MMKKLFEQVERVREIKPLVHHITNYVTANDCANVTLAIGASPIMADALDEAPDITRISSALVLNMGTLNERTVPSMLAAGQAANEANIPIIFDPVGAGASKLRNETASHLLNKIKLRVLRGNISEMRFLANLPSETRGVDASDTDLKDTTEAVNVAKSLASYYKCVVAITGAVDIVSDGEKIVRIKNGHAMLSNLTGTGCMCASLIGSFCGASPNNIFEATVAAQLAMGIAGEIAFENAGKLGNGSFRIALLDAISCLDAEILKRRANFNEA